MRRLTCNNSIAYLKNWTDNFFQIFFMGTSWVAVSINNITTRASREMTSRKNINIFDFNGVNVAKHWHVAGRGICHLWLPCYMMFVTYLVSSVLCISQLNNPSRLPHPRHLKIFYRNQNLCSNILVELDLGLSIEIRNDSLILMCYVDVSSVF